MDNNIELKVGVKALLKNPQGQYLLMKRNQQKYPDINNVWDIPGGRIDAGSTLIENLRREIKEETGLDLSDTPTLISAQDILRVPGKHVVRLTYLANIQGVPLLNGEEHDEYRWLTLDELKNNTYNLALDIYLKDVIDNNLVQEDKRSDLSIEDTTIDPDIKPGIYEHFKGAKCKVIGVGRHSETKEEVVIYQHLENSPEYGPNALWVRPKSMFLENVEVPRFKFISE